MATITINKRRDPIVIANDRAEKIKRDWLSPLTNKDSIVDLGPWTGSWREIKSIEIEKEFTTDREPIEDIDKDRYKFERDKFNKLPAEEKAQLLSEFTVNYQIRHEFKRPPLEVLEQGYKRQLEYYKANPTAQYVPREYYEDLLA